MGGMKDRVESLGEEAWEVLQRLVREALARKPGGHLVASSLDRLDLSVRLAMRGAEADPLTFARELAASVDRLLDEAIEEAVAFRPGRAYCHRCGGSDCPHSLPPSCRHVCVGYARTGTPSWTDLAQHCLELKHPEVDRLYGQPPAFVTLVQGRQQLREGMLPAFRHGSFEVLGQMTAGFFRVPARPEEGRGVVAITFQASAARSKGRRRRIGLNVLGRAPSGEGLDTLWDRQDDLPWRRAVSWAQGALRSLSGGAVDERVEGILRGLARRLERDQRARSRRTRHAESRHESGRRPTRKAIDDARSAGPDSCMVDRRSEALVVMGDRGRTHFFTPDGQLVTSVRYSKDAIARKIKNDVWRRVTAEELAAVRAQILGQAPSD